MRSTNIFKPQEPFPAAKAVIFGLGFGAVLAGCGGGSGSRANVSPPPPAVQGLLVPAGTAATLTTTLTNSFTKLAQPASANNVSERFERPPVDEVLLALPSTPAAGLADDNQTAFSTTYTQEANVGEFDVVKYDGQRMFIAPQRGYYPLAAATVATQSSALPPAETGRAIRVLTTDVDNATATETARIELDENVSVQGMYLHNDRLAALTSENFYGGWGADWVSTSVWQNQENGITLYDLTQGEQPQQIWEASLDGSLIDSRRVGDIIYLFTRYAPYVDGLVDRPANEEQRQGNQDLLDTIEPDALLPKIRINGVEQTLVDPAKCLITNTSSDAAGRRPDSQPADSALDEEQVTNPILTIITAINTNDPDNVQTLCYSEPTYGLYASSTAVYLNQPLFGSEPNAEQTRIHKFTLDGLAYEGSAEVPGLLWSGGQLDFRASEHNGDLRIMTTRNTNDRTDAFDHELHVLRTATDRPELEILASLPNTEQSAEIGKPNEALYGVRFFGDRAYAVTFEQIDPLYVIDLADPERPRIAGELEVTGFSDFLHPVSDDLLLGLGFTEDRAIKLELFDVSDITAPRSVVAERLGGAFSHSEALYNRHAFTYLPNVVRGDTTVDRFALPADLYSDDESFVWSQSGLYLYEIGNTSDPAAATLNSVGSMIFDTPTEERQWPIGGRYRSVFDTDTVYLIRNEEVFSAFWDDPGAVNGPL